MKKRTFQTLIFSITLFISAVAAASTCNLPTISGKLTNNTAWATDDLYMKLEIYAPKQGYQFATRESEYFQKSVVVNLAKDGSFQIPEMTYKKVDGLYIFPDLYRKSTNERIKVAGMTENGLFMDMSSVSAFLCSGFSYKSTYKSFFSQLTLQTLNDIEVSVRTPDGSTFGEYMSSLLRKTRPEYLASPFFYEVQLFTYIKITGTSTSGRTFEGYVNNEDLEWQGVKSCSRYDICFADSKNPESLNHYEYALSLSKYSPSKPVVILAPVDQLKGPLKFEVMADFYVNIFQQGDPKIYEHLFFREAGAEKMLGVEGSLKQVATKHQLYFQNPTFCKTKLTPTGPTYCL